MVTGKGIKNLSTIGGIISSGLIIISYIYPDMISSNAGGIAMGASTMLNRESTLINIGYGEEVKNTIQEEYINEEDGIFNRKVESI